MSDMTFVPTAQGPGPNLTRTSSMGNLHVEAAAGQKADSPPPTIEQAAAATAAAVNQVLYQTI